MITANEVRKIQKEFSIVDDILEKFDSLIRTRAKEPVNHISLELPGITSTNVDQIISKLEEAGYAVQDHYRDDPYKYPTLLILW